MPISWSVPLEFGSPCASPCTKGSVARWLINNQSGRYDLIVDSTTLWQQDGNQVGSFQDAVNDPGVEEVREFDIVPGETLLFEARFNIGFPQAIKPDDLYIAYYAVEYTGCNGTPLPFRAYAVYWEAVHPDDMEIVSGGPFQQQVRQITSDFDLVGWANDRLDEFVIDCREGLGDGDSGGGPPPPGPSGDDEDDPPPNPDDDDAPGPNDGPDDGPGDPPDDDSGDGPIDNPPIDPPPDSDGDGTPDGEDRDDDNDGVPDPPGPTNPPPEDDPRLPSGDLPTTTPTDPDHVDPAIEGVTVQYRIRPAYQGLHAARVLQVVATDL